MIDLNDRGLWLHYSDSNFLYAQSIKQASYLITRIAELHKSFKVQTS